MKTGILPSLARSAGTTRLAKARQALAGFYHASPCMRLMAPLCMFMKLTTCGCTAYHLHHYSFYCSPGEPAHPAFCPPPPPIPVSGGKKRGERKRRRRLPPCLPFPSLPRCPHHPTTPPTAHHLPHPTTAPACTAHHTDLPAPHTLAPPLPYASPLSLPSTTAFAAQHSSVTTPRAHCRGTATCAGYAVRFKPWQATSPASLAYRADSAFHNNNSGRLLRLFLVCPAQYSTPSSALSDPACWRNGGDGDSGEGYLRGTGARKLAGQCCLRVPLFVRSIAALRLVNIFARFGMGLAGYQARAGRAVAVDPVYGIHRCKPQHFCWHAPVQSLWRSTVPTSCIPSRSHFSPRSASLPHHADF